MFNKKAMAAEQIITVLFVLVAFAALLVYVNYSAKPAISQTADDAACALSVKKAVGLARIPGRGITSLKELEGCKTKDMTRDETAPDDVHKILADNLFSCWNNFGRPAYRKENLDFLKDIDTKDLCFVCSKIRFTNAVNDVDLLSLHLYMIKNKKYEQALFSSKVDVEQFSNIKENQKFYVALVATKSVAVQVSGMWTLALDIITKLSADDTTPLKVSGYSIALFSSDKITKYCKEIA